jgi:DNA-binding LytR/AlgR family response regulator
MRVGILEDEPRDRDALSRLVVRWSDERGVRLREEEYADAESFLAACARTPFDVALLDCYIETDQLDAASTAMSGMDVARAIRGRGQQTCIVFTTSSRDYAVEGYEVQALGYLLKPIDYAKLAALLDRAAGQLAHDPAKSPQPIPLKTTDGPVLVDPSLIVWCRSRGHYIEIHLAQGHVARVRMTLTELTDLLGTDGRFYSSARGYLVNLDEVAEVDGLDFSLCCGGSVPISQGKHSEARAAWARRVFARMRA